MQTKHPTSKKTRKQKSFPSGPEKRTRRIRRRTPPLPSPPPFLPSFLPPTKRASEGGEGKGRDRGEGGRGGEERRAWREREGGAPKTPFRRLGALWKGGLLTPSARPCVLSTSAATANLSLTSLLSQFISVFSS